MGAQGRRAGAGTRVPPKAGGQSETVTVENAQTTLSRARPQLLAKMPAVLPGLLLLLSAHALAPPLDDGRCLRSCGYNETPARGFCEGGRVPRCACQDAWSGGAGDCSERACPSGPAWWDVPLDAVTAHTAVVECSGVGLCNRGTGRCVCGGL